MINAISDPEPGCIGRDSANIDVSIYSREVVVAVAGRFTDDYYMSIQDVNGQPATLSVKHKTTPMGDSSADILGLIENALIEQQLRFDLNKRFGYLRDQIVVKAFAPIKRTSP